MLGAGWEGRLGCRGWLAGGLPLVGKQLSKVALGMAADASEEVAEVGERVDGEALASGDQAGQDGGGLSPDVAAIKHPILPARRDSPQAALSPIVIDLQIAVLRIASQCFPVGPPAASVRKITVAYCVQGQPPASPAQTSRFP